MTPREHINLQAAVIVDKDGRSGTGPLVRVPGPRPVHREDAEGGHGGSTGTLMSLPAPRITEEEGIVYHVSKGRVSRLQMTEQCVTWRSSPWLNKKAYGF